MNYEFYLFGNDQALRRKMKFKKYCNDFSKINEIIGNITSNTPSENVMIILHRGKVYKQIYLSFFYSQIETDKLINFSNYGQNFEIIFVSSSNKGWPTLKVVRDYLLNEDNIDYSVLEGFFYLEMLELAFTEGDNPDKIIAELEDGTIKINREEIKEEMGLKWEDGKIRLIRKCTQNDNTICFNNDDIIEKIKKALKALDRYKKKQKISEYWCEIRKYLFPMFFYEEVKNFYQQYEKEEISKQDEIEGIIGKIELLKKKYNDKMEKFKEYINSREEKIDINKQYNDRTRVSELLSSLNEKFNILINSLD